MAENRTQLTGDFVKRVAPEVKAAATKAGLLSKDVDLAVAIDARFIPPAM